MADRLNKIVDFLAYIQSHVSHLLSLTWGHIEMVGYGVGLALLVGVPLGIICAKKQRIGKGILSLANMIQVFPSLALLAMLMIIFGLGFKTVVIGLFLYSLLPIIRNTFVGLKEVDRGIYEAGRGLGMSSLQLLIKVQLPMALPFIMAGVRVAVVIAVGVATIAPLIGGEGLGREIYSGITMRNNILIYAGAIPAALLAIAADLVLGKLQHKLEIRK